MAKGYTIIATADPMGTRVEGVIVGTPYPGMILQQKAATAPVSGRFSYEARSLAAGSKGEFLVLLEDDYQGFLAMGATLATGGNAVGTAYVTGTRGFLYDPVAGDELNLLVGSVAGTADDVAIGDLFGVNNDGKLKADSSYTSAPFKAGEVITDPTVDYLLFGRYLGNNA